MEARAGMFTSSLDPKALCHLMILLINTVMQMNIRSMPSNESNSHYHSQLLVLMLIMILNVSYVLRPVG